ncbi:MAG TPA: ROK family protein [Acidisarcina sp.]|nr:ROK family protein [Acidisarcina sp.]
MSRDAGVELLVFDVGGSHIACGVLSLKTGTLSQVRRTPTPVTGPSEEFFRAVEVLGKQLLTAPEALAGLALAVPNPFDYERGISYMEHKYQYLYGVDLRRALADRFACDPSRIHFLNDAAAFLIGEIHQGAAVGIGRSIGITLGTGVGSAFAVNGRIVTDDPNVPPGGEIWNLSYREGIVEDVISGRSIREIYKRLTGSMAEVREIARRAAEDAIARQAFEIFGQELGKVLRATCAAFHPERIVFGGAISHSGDLFLPAARAELASDTIELCVSQLFDNAPLIGAGISWQQQQGVDRHDSLASPTAR